MKIGIYGGTFNPVHLGHINIVTEFYRRLKLDKLIIIPTKIPPHKEGNNLLSGEVRIEMLKIAFSEFTDINYEISDIELNRDGRSYTSDTLKELRLIYPNDAFYLLMGEDMFRTVHQWVRSEEILKEAIICGCQRSFDEITDLHKHAEKIKVDFPFFRYVIENIDYIDISSTELRDNISDYSFLNKYLPKKLVDYITTNNLYNCEV